MPDIDPAPLFEPYRIRDIELKNRFVMPSMTTFSAPNGCPSPANAEYYRARVEGGTPFIIGGGSIDHPSSTWHSDFARFTPESADGWRRIAEEVHAAGGVFLAQLQHEGAIRQEGKGGPDPSAPTISPSGLCQKDNANGRSATDSDLEELKEAYARTAQLAIEAGADGVEFHSAHGYLLDQFLWAETNVREDSYGGPMMENRVRFPAELVAAVRHAIGPKPIISIRFSQWKEIDYHAKIFQTPDDLQIFVRALEAAGVDIFHASTRRFFLPEWPESPLSLAGWTRSMTDRTVITVGSVGLDVDLMNNLFGGQEATNAIEKNLGALVEQFNAGHFDLVAIGRSNLSDPDWVNKVKAGRFSEIKPFERHILEEMLAGWDPGLIVEAHA